MTSNEDAGNRILGSLRSAGGKGVVRIEDRFDTDIDDLWSALTDPVRLARWHDQAEGDLRPGGAFREYLEADDVESTRRVEACEPPRRRLVPPGKRTSPGGEVWARSRATKSSLCSTAPVGTPALSSRCPSTSTCTSCRPIRPNSTQPNTSGD
jgi:hypothetical protein